jgi:Holliday junction resolvase RusA-like endonuclease
MTTLRTDGKPLATFVFWHVPSWNDVIAWANQRPRRVKSHAQARYILNSHIQEWREKAHKMGLLFKLRNPVCGTYLIANRALVVVRVIRGTERKYDVHNVWTKAIFDGFSDAGLWPDDEWANVPTVVYTWAFDTKGWGQRVEIEIHELDSLLVNGVSQTLPLERIVNRPIVKMPQKPRLDNEWWKG